MTARDTVFDALHSALTGLGCSSNAIGPFWDELEQRYSEPHRHYHSLDHIASMLKGAQDLQADDPALILAILYHDLIYDPARSDNEDQSAAYVRIKLGTLIDEALAERAAIMIEATKSHQATGDDLTDLLLDLDMAILGTPWADYQPYVDAIAREYIPVYGNDAYTAGRIAMFLKPVLGQARIFLTPTFNPREVQARENLLRELLSLNV